VHLAYSDEQESLRQRLRAYYSELLSPEVEEELSSARGVGPTVRRIVRRMGEDGWLGIGWPKEHGGQGRSALEQFVFFDESMRAGAPVPMLTINTVGPTIQQFGTAEQKESFLPRILRGEIHFCIGYTEPGAGTDLASLTTRATLDGSEYVINGQKTWITGAHAADHILLVCRTTRGEDKHHGLSMISVPADVEGIEVRGIDTMGGREVNDVFFTDCQVPAERLVGQQDQAWMQLMAGLNPERLIIAAQSLGMARRAFDDVLAYVKERKQFGRPIGSFQAIKHKCADMLLEVESAKSAAYYAGWAAAEDNDELPVVASLAKSYCSEAYFHAAAENIQIHGGIGFTWEHPAHLYFKRAKSSELLFGDPTYHRELLAQRIGL